VFVASEHGLDVLDYEPPPLEKQFDAPRRDARFSKKGKFSFDLQNENIVATGTAPFGTVLELDNRVVVLRSDGQIETFDGEVVHWRAFPRSENYSNQLHLIYDDHIRIVSFMHDYFVEQTGKLMGFAKGSNDFLDSSSLDPFIDDIL
jgi:hypothetical protein